MPMIGFMCVLSVDFFIRTQTILFSLSLWNARNIKSLSDVQIAQVACGYWHSHALSRGEDGLYPHNAHLFTPHMLKTFRVMSVSFHRRPSLLLGPKSIWTTWAGNKRTEHFHTPDHTVFAGYSFCPDISRWCSQLCPHSLRSRVWLGAQQVWPTGSQWH